MFDFGYTNSTDKQFERIKEYEKKKQKCKVT